MSREIIAYDLGTGGAKASLYAEDGACLGTAFSPYDTFYPATGWHEQRPADWWAAMVRTTGELLSKTSGGRIGGLAISGQSLGAVPVDASGALLRERTPIWSDTRAVAQVARFFDRVDPTAWYLTTGNGFPAPCYAVFKAMWYQEHEPGTFRRVRHLLGSKDWVNLRLTGRAVTDGSYASGSGVWNLRGWAYEDAFLRASGLPPEVFPEALPSTEVVGELLPSPARELGLPAGVPVVCGGVDNSCMALGARNVTDGRIYTSLGSSSWIAVSSRQPVVDAVARPYVFAHVVPEHFTSAVSIFAGGSALRWVRDVLLGLRAEELSGRDPYEVMTEMAARSPLGAHRLLFNPSLAGGSSQEPSPALRGGFYGLDLRHGRDDLVRAVLEGVALNLGAVLGILRRAVRTDDEVLLVGGGARSALWCQILADIYGMRVVKTSVDQDAASLGAAALAAVGCGVWKDLTVVDRLHRVERTHEPRPEATAAYARLLPIFERTRVDGAALSEQLQAWQP
jgi:xylulokinase